MSKLNSQLFLRNIIILLIFAFSMSLSAQTQKSKREELKVVSAISSIPLSLVGQGIAVYNFTLKNKNNVVIPFSKKIICNYLSGKHLVEIHFKILVETQHNILLLEWK